MMNLNELERLLLDVQRHIDAKQYDHAQRAVIAAKLMVQAEMAKAANEKH